MGVADDRSRPARASYIWALALSSNMLEQIKQRALAATLEIATGLCFAAMYLISISLLITNRRPYSYPGIASKHQRRNHAVAAVTPWRYRSFVVTLPFGSGNRTAALFRQLSTVISPAGSTTEKSSVYGFVWSMRHHITNNAQPGVDTRTAFLAAICASSSTKRNRASLL